MLIAVASRYHSSSRGTAARPTASLELDLLPQSPRVSPRLALPASVPIHRGQPVVARRACRRACGGVDDYSNANTAVAGGARSIRRGGSDQRVVRDRAGHGEDGREVRGPLRRVGSAHLVVTSITPRQSSYVAHAPHSGGERFLAESERALSEPLRTARSRRFTPDANSASGWAVRECAVVGCRGVQPTMGSPTVATTMLPAAEHACRSVAYTLRCVPCRLLYVPLRHGLDSQPECHTLTGVTRHERIGQVKDW